MCCGDKCNPLLLCFYVLLREPSATFARPNAASGNVANLREVPTFAVLQQFQVAAQVTCHNSGKSL